MDTNKVIVEIDVTGLQSKYLQHLNEIKITISEHIKKHGFVQADGTFALHKGYAQRLFNPNDRLFSADELNNIFQKYVETFIED